MNSRRATKYWAFVAVLATWVSHAGAQLTLPAQATRLPPPSIALAQAEPIPMPLLQSEAASEKLTLAEAEQMAVAFHPSLRRADGMVSAARGNWVQVGLKPNPAIGYSGNEIGDEGEAGQQGGFVSQEFVTAGKLGLNRAVAMREIAVAQQRMEQTRLQVITTVRTYYFEMLAAQRSVELARQLSGIAMQSTRVSELRLKALDIPRSSLLQSQIEGDLATLLEQQSGERLTAAWRRLATTLGIEDQLPHELDDALLQPLPALSWDTTRARVLGSSPELAELRFAVDRARAAVERATAGRSPNVDVQAGVARDYATDDTIANVQLSVPVPVFDRNQGAIAQACGELRAAQAALEQRELALEQRLAAAFRDFATARARIDRYTESILPRARETLEIINRGYQEGELEYMQVLSVQQTYAQSNLSYLQDLETAWKKWAEIDGMLVGVLPETSN